MVEAVTRLGSVDSVSAAANGAPFEELVSTLKKAVAALRDAKVPYLLGGGLAIWARGGPERDHDLDFLVKAEDSARALQALVDAGMTPQRPPEGWLFKAYDDNGVLVDLIFRPSENPVTQEMLARGDELEVMAIKVNVVAAGDVLVSKLLALREHELDFDTLIEMTRAVREQVDWQDVRERTEHSPFARAFFTLAEGLELVEPHRESTAR
jgi:predicted nucleotidyltransferase